MISGGAGAIIGGQILSGILAGDAAGDAADATSAASQAQIAEIRRQFDLTRGDTAPYRDVGQASLYRLSDIFGLTPQGGFQSQQPAPVQAPGQPMSFEDWSRQNPNVNIANAGEAYNQYLNAQQGGVQASQPGGGGAVPGGGMMYAGGTPGFYAPGGGGGITGPGGAPVPPGASSTPGQSVADMVLASSPGYQFRLDQGIQARERASSRYRFSPRAAKEMERYAQGFASNEFGNFLESQFRLAGLGGNAVNTSATAGANAAAGIGGAHQFAGAGAANAAISGAAGINNAIQGGLQNYLTLDMYNRMLPRAA